MMDLGEDGDELNDGATINMSMDLRRRLFDAAQNGDAEFVSSTLSQGVIHVNQVYDDNCCSLLHYAAANGHEQLARRLLDHSADPNVVTQYGWTP